MTTVFSITVLSFLAAVIFAQAAYIMTAFPPAKEGMVRYVLELPQQDDEAVKL
jgi:serine protease inhibitor ecotin